MTRRSHDHSPTAPTGSRAAARGSSVRTPRRARTTPASPVPTARSSCRTSEPRRWRRFLLPNVTRTLGGSNGWTTPILIQTTSATGATIEWRRFSDGQLVTTQNLAIAAGTGVRIDPRAVAQLSDDTQYAVTVTAIGGAIAAIVTELNFLGGDGAMIYEGFPSP